MAARDPADWTVASYNDHPVDHLEPIEPTSTVYRAAALEHLARLLAIDRFMTSSQDSRLAWVSVSATLNLTSTRGMTPASIATELGVSESKLNHSVARFVRHIGTV